MCAGGSAFTGSALATGADVFVVYNGTGTGSVLVLVLYFTGTGSVYLVLNTSLSIMVVPFVCSSSEWMNLLMPPVGGPCRMAGVRGPTVDVCELDVRQRPCPGHCEFGFSRVRTWVHPRDSRV